MDLNSWSSSISNARLKIRASYLGLLSCSSSSSRNSRWAQKSWLTVWRRERWGLGAKSGILGHCGGSRGGRGWRGCGGSLGHGWGLRRAGGTPDVGKVLQRVPAAGRRVGQCAPKSARLKMSTTMKQFRKALAMDHKTHTHTHTHMTHMHIHMLYSAHQITNSQFPQQRQLWTGITIPTINQTHTHTHTYAHTHTRMHACTHAYTHTHTRVCARAHTHTK